MKISRDLLKDVEIGLGKGSSSSRSDHRAGYIQLMLVVAALEDIIDENQYANFADGMSDKNKAQRLILDFQSNGPFGRQVVEPLQRKLGLDVDGAAGHGTITALHDYADGKNFPGPGLEVGHPQMVPTYMDINPSIVKPTMSSGKYGYSDNLSPYARGEVRRGYTPMAGPGAITDAGAAVAGTAGATALAATIQSAMQAQGEQMVRSGGDQIGREENHTVGQAVGDAVTKSVDRIGNFFSKGNRTAAFNAMKNVFVKTAEDGKVIPKAVPIAVVLAVGLGGAFAWRKYLRNRKNQELAREFARNQELRREMENMMRQSGMDKYAGKDGMDAVRSIERYETRQPEFRGYYV